MWVYETKEAASASAAPAAVAAVAASTASTAAERPPEAETVVLFGAAQDREQSIGKP